MDLNKNKSQNLLRCHNVSYGKLSESEKKFSESVLVQGDRYGRKKEKKKLKGNLTLSKRPRVQAGLVK